MAKAYIQARKNGLQSCLDAIDKVRDQACAKVDKAEEKYGKDSDQYGEAIAELTEVEATVRRWKGIVTGRQHDLALAAVAEAAESTRAAAHDKAPGKARAKDRSKGDAAAAMSTAFVVTHDMLATAAEDEKKATE